MRGPARATATRRVRARAASLFVGAPQLGNKNDILLALACASRAGGCLLLALTLGAGAASAWWIVAPLVSSASTHASRTAAGARAASREALSIVLCWRVLNLEIVRRRLLFLHT